MSWRIRTARADDFESLFELAQLAGPGFTNLPSDRDSIRKRLDWNERSLDREADVPENELYILLLEELETGRVGGTAVLFSRLGAEWPFYSYKRSTLTQTSKELGRTVSTDVLHLVNDFHGASEVGGLFLRPELRKGGLGRLLARSRYLFIAQHRNRFSDPVVAELRGWLRDGGSSPFWDSIGRLFFKMPFQEADLFNSIHGNQFIADLMPKYPIYVAMLSSEAQDVIGQPNSSGLPALKMLEREGFQYHGYVDIFDGGPTLAARIDGIRTIRNTAELAVVALTDATEPLHRSIVAAGRLRQFRAAAAQALRVENGLVLDAEALACLEIGQGDVVRHVED